METKDKNRRDKIMQNDESIIILTELDLLDRLIYSMYDYQKIEKTHSRYPNRLVNLICCFIPKRKNRHKCRRDHSK